MPERTPPPMTEATFARGVPAVEPHDHAVFVYGDAGELGAGLARFIAEGARRDALNVFVHGFQDDEHAWRFVEEHSPGARRLADGELVLVSLYRDAFEGQGKAIDHEHVARVLGALVDRARRASRASVRIFVDASRHYFDARRDAEWFAFERWLGRRLQANAGLVCAYRRADATRPDLFPEMLRTHAYRFDAH